MNRAIGVAPARLRVPASAFFAVSAVFHYLGPSFAVLLFAHVDVLGVAWLRIVSAAVIFALWRFPVRSPFRFDARTTSLIIALGTVLAAMNACFYMAIARLPLATVGAIEFLGTVLIAAAAVRTPRNAAALALTTMGVAVVTQVRFVGEPLGFAFAFANCVLFMLYIVLGHRIANLQQGGGSIDRLAAAMAVAAVTITPAGAAAASRAFTDPRLLLAGVGVGVCSSVIPYVTDQLAMARLPRSTFALMLALLPVCATLVGAIVLHQVPTPQDVGGIALVSTGVALHRGKTS